MENYIQYELIVDTDLIEDMEEVEAIQGELTEAFEYFVNCLEYIGIEDIDMISIEDERKLIGFYYDEAIETKITNAERTTSKKFYEVAIFNEYPEEA